MKENGLRFLVDLEGGQKTGFYLDQRENRRRAETRAAGRTALDVFCYQGEWAMSMARGGAAPAADTVSVVPGVPVSFPESEQARASRKRKAEVRMARG